MLKLSIIFFLVLICRLSAAAPPVGVFYYPGWKDNQNGNRSSLPWESIKAFPEREPILSWYPEGQLEITEQHLQWMKRYGIDYVIYDWYWLDNRPILNHALDSYFQSSGKRDVNFALLWANHDERPKSLDEFTRMVEWWTSYYFNQPEYVFFEGKPVIYVFSAKMLEDSAKKFSSSTAELFRLANTIAVKKGFKGIYFVGGGTYDSMPLQNAKSAGYQALSSYNYHEGVKDGVLIPFSTSYKELIAGYSRQWSNSINKSTLNYIVPVTAGWDKRPWGGSEYPSHDQSFGVPSLFYQHLLSAAGFLKTNPFRARNGIVICCWNEFGEGSYIEPTKKDGFIYLENVYKVFGSK